MDKERNKEGREGDRGKTERERERKRKDRRKREKDGRGRKKTCEGARAKYSGGSRVTVTLTRWARVIHARLSSCTDIMVALVRGAERRARAAVEADQLLHTHTHVNEGERMKPSLG